MKFFKARRGFTLIELLVVIAIIGILASIVMVSLSSAQSKGRDTKRVADIRTIQLSLEEYYNDNGYYPTSLSALTPNYIAVIPTDPKNNGTSYLYSAYNAPGNPICTTTNKPVKYHLAAVMESTNSTNSALNQDVDATYASLPATQCTNTTATFDGNALNCSGTSAQALSVDNCYDETN